MSLDLLDSLVLLPCSLASYSRLSREVSGRAITALSCQNTDPELLATVWSVTRSFWTVDGQGDSTSSFLLENFSSFHIEIEILSAEYDSWIPEKSYPSGSLLFLRHSKPHV